MNVYDFDKTIYNGDSTIDFYLFCLCRHPVIISSIGRQACGIFLHMAHRINTTVMKECFFSFLSKLDDTEELANLFWEQKQRKIKKWYLQEKCETDVIVSASPEFLLEPICKKLKIQPPIATRVDIYSGTIQGENCKGKEKVHRFRERYPETIICKFYSDSKTDAPLADIAQEAFLVKTDDVYPW